MYRVAINLIISVLSQDIHDITLKLHNILTKLGIQAYIDRSLQNVVAMNGDINVELFTSRLGRAVMNIQTKCLESKECITKLNNLISLTNFIVKELKIVAISDINYIVKREVMYERIHQLSPDNVDALLRWRGFMKVSSSRKEVDLGLGSGELLTYKYEYISNRLNPILIDIIYLFKESSLSIVIITFMRPSKATLTVDFFPELMSLSDTVLAVIEDSLK